MFTTTPPPPFVSRLNWMFSENIPHFGETDSSGYIQRFGEDMALDFGVPTYDRAETTNGFNQPYWERDENWLGNGGNN
jgi:hypothetical protein